MLASLGVYGAGVSYSGDASCVHFRDWSLSPGLGVVLQGLPTAQMKTQVRFLAVTCVVIVSNPKPILLMRWNRVVMHP